MQTPKKTDHGIKTKRYTFSLVPYTLVPSTAFHVELKSLINNF